MSRLFAQPFVQEVIKETAKAPRHWPLCGESTGHRWIPSQQVSNAQNVSIWLPSVSSVCPASPYYGHSLRPGCVSFVYWRVCFVYWHNFYSYTKRNFETNDTSWIHIAGLHVTVAWQCVNTANRDRYHKDCLRYNGVKFQLPVTKYLSLYDRPSAIARRNSEVGNISILKI